MIYQLLDANKVQNYTKEKNCFFRGHLYYKECFYNGNINSILNEIKTEEEFFESLKQFNGNFCLIFNFDGKTYLVADRIMSFPLFYSKAGTDVYVADSIEQLKSALKINSVDKHVAKEFLAAGFVLRNSTVFENIKFVLAGTCAVIDNQTGQVTIRRYFNHVHKNYIHGDMNELVSMLERATDSVFKRMTKELDGRQIALFLSGGYDSRLVAVMLHKCHYKNVICFSFKTRKGKEEEVARGIADDLGYKWILLDSVEVYKEIAKDSDYERYMLEASGGITLPYMQGCLIKKYIENGTLDKDCVVLTGNSGDVIEGNDFSTALMGKEYFTKDEVVEAIIDVHCCQYGIKFGHQKYIWNLVKHSIPDKDQYTYDDAQDVFEAFNWQHRQTKYVVNDIRCYDAYLGVDWRLPLWDNELVDFWLRIPTRIREKRKLYYYYVRKETYDTANIESLYGKLREWLRKKLNFILYFLYPIRKIYEFKTQEKWMFYGVNFREYLKILRVNGGYKTNAMTTRAIKFFDTYYRSLVRKKEN